MRSTSVDKIVHHHGHYGHEGHQRSKCVKKIVFVSLVSFVVKSLNEHGAIVLEGAGLMHVDK